MVDMRMSKAHLLSDQLLPLADSRYLSRKKTSLVTNRLLAYTGTSTPVTAYSWTRPKATLEQTSI
jgi:hypothetical protein